MVPSSARNWPTLGGHDVSFGGSRPALTDRPEAVANPLRTAPNAFDQLPSSPTNGVLHHGALVPLLALASRDLAWLALLIPVVVLVQFALIRLRNRVRDRIHGPPPLSPPSPSSPPTEADLETVIGEELGAVFDDPANVGDDSADEAQRRARLVELAAIVADRSDDRLDLTDRERATLRTTLITALLDAFGHSPSALPDDESSEAVELGGGVVEDLPKGRVVE